METKVQEQARVVSSLMAKIVQSAANVATSAVDDMTTEYEKNRLARIRKNKENVLEQGIMRIRQGSGIRKRIFNKEY